VAGPIADYLIAEGLSNADGYRGSFIAALILIAIGIVVLLVSFRYTKKNVQSSQTIPDEDILS